MANTPLIHRVLRRFSLPLAALLLAFSPPPSGALAGQELPDARALVDRHIELLGGRDFILSRNAATISGHFSMPAVGITADVLIAIRPPNQRVMVMEVPGMGEIRGGFTGEVAWSLDPMTGPRVLEGAEREAQVEQSEPAAILRDPSFVQEMVTVEETELGGERCYRVRVLWRSGRESFDCYGVESGFLVALETVQPSPMGEVRVVTLVQEYRELGGMMTATRTVQQMMGQEQRIEIRAIELGTPDPALFELPTQIRGLLPPDGER